jgi:hypothetical protein
MSKSALRETIAKRLVQPVPSRAQAGRSPRLAGMTVGRILLLDPSGVPMVGYRGNSRGGLVPARTVVALRRSDVGREAVLLFEDGDRRRPVIVGLIHAPSTKEPVDVRLDGRTLTLTGEQEVVLQCGKASLTLTRSGKVLLRGAYLSSRSSGVNRIKGGSVQIN